MSHHPRSRRAVTIGETLGLVLSTDTGPIRTGAQARLGCAGAESNVAIGLARLGHQVAYISRVGDDSFGRMIRNVLAGEGVDMRCVAVDAGAPTGLMLRSHRTADKLRVDYHRQGSAACNLTPDEIPVALVRDAAVLHISGITFGIGSSARDAASHALAIAHDAGLTVSLDVNYRARVWSPTVAGQVLRRVLGYVDVVFGGGDELAMLCAAEPTSPEDAAQQILAAGPSTVIWKRGTVGAVAFSAAGRIDIAALPVTQIDAVGAGDAFVAGYLSGVLDREPVLGCLARAVECGAFAVSVDGDWEGLPRRDELGSLGVAADIDR